MSNSATTNSDLNKLFGFQLMASYPSAATPKIGGDEYIQVYPDIHFGANMEAMEN